MPEIGPKTIENARKVNPRVLSALLASRRPELHTTALNQPHALTDIAFPYDPEVLGKRLGSIPVPGIKVNNIGTIAGQVLDNERDMAFGKGFEGALHELLSFQKNNENPHAAWNSRYEESGDVWVETAVHGFIQNAEGQLVNATSFGLMPLRYAIPEIEKEYMRRCAFNNGSVHPNILLDDVDETFNRIPEALNTEFEVIGVRWLPETVSTYTECLQKEVRKCFARKIPFKFDEFRNSYFDLDPANPDMSNILREIKQEYLGDTTWGTIVAAQSLTRVADFALGLPYGISALRDFFQGYTGKEFPFPGVERTIRHVLRNKNLPLPAETFNKPGKSRILEFVSAFVGVVSTMLPPALLAEVPIDLIMQIPLIAQKFEHSFKLFKPFLEIAEETKTKPKALDKVQNWMEVVPAVLGWRK